MSPIQQHMQEKQTRDGDEAAVDRWRKLAAHRKVQSKGRREIFDDYSIKVLQVLRNYGMTDREEAPKDSLKVHV